jgi:hypothetical protein
MSNVRPKEREYKVGTELRHESLDAKSSFRRNSRAFATAASQVTVCAGRPRFAGQRTTCTLPRESNSFLLKVSSAGESKNSNSSLRSPAVLHASESLFFGYPRAATFSYSLLSAHARSKTARFQESGRAKIVVASTKA